MVKLGIGTVQFGMDYGISNTDGKSAPNEVRKILELASESSIQIIDTATKYGESEKVLGKSLREDHDFKIVTKTPSFDCSKITETEADLLEKTFQASLEKLNHQCVPGSSIWCPLFFP